MVRKTKSFRMGRVRGDIRGKIWYLTYYDQDQRYRPRIGQDIETARQRAAEINAQLESGHLVIKVFQSISMKSLQSNWLDYHENTARSSLRTVARYRSATNHLVTFVERPDVPATIAQFRVDHAEQFVRYLRKLKVTPNGHPHSVKRSLRNKGIRYILEVCRSIFNFALKRRHLPPYSENPFTALELDRLSVEDSKPIVLFDERQEEAFLRNADNWQFPIFLTLMLTGMRPGELAHLRWPDDDEQKVFEIRNRTQLGWQVKTRQERTIPIHPVLNDILSLSLKNRSAGMKVRK